MSTPGLRRRWAGAAVCGLATLLAGPPAVAHLTPTGLGSFSDGAVRLALLPSDLLLVCGVCLLAAQQGSDGWVKLRVVVPVAWLLGGIVGLGLRAELTTPWINTVAFSLVGLLVALEAPLKRSVTMALAVLAGLWCGLINGSALAFHDGSVPSLLGGVASVVALTWMLTWALRPPHPEWLRIGLRVAGSWIAATGLLMVGWLLRVT